MTEGPTEDQIPPAEEPAPNPPEPTYPPESPKNAIKILRAQASVLENEINQLEAQLDSIVENTKVVKKEIQDRKYRLDGLNAAVRAIKDLPDA